MTRIPPPTSPFIRPIHPKTEIRPQPEAIARILKLGWAGQMKIHGHRAQIHLHADAAVAPVAYNRQGQPHKQQLTSSMIAELRRILPLKAGWTVIDGEWLKPRDHLYLFDILKLNDQNLKGYSYAERYEILPQVYTSEHIETLALFKSVGKCMETLDAAGEHLEGLVFRALNTKGFSDTSIVRCRILNRN